MSSEEPAPDSGRHRQSSSHPGYRMVAVGSVRVVVAAVSTVLLLVIGYAWYNYTALNNNEKTVALSGLGTAPTSAGATGSAASAAGVQHIDGTAQNILIVGLDSRAGLSSAQKRLLKVGQNDQTTSTDTIMIVHVPANGKNAKLLSIPRDTWVNIDGFSSFKINAAYADGYYNDGATTTAQAEVKGAQLLLNTVKELTGVTIDHYVEVGFEGFYDIAKAIGGINVNLCQAVDDTHAYNVSIGGSGGSGFKMSAGEHHLNAVQSLEFVRQRHNIPGPITDDFGREQRQRYFLSAAFKKVLSAGVLLNPLKFHSLINAVDNAFTMSPEFNIETFAEQMSDLSAGNITGKTIPTTPQTIDGQDALAVNVQQVQKFVHNYFYGPTATAKPSTSGTPSSASSSTSASSTPSGSPSKSDTATPSCIY